MGNLKAAWAEVGSAGKEITVLAALYGLPFEDFSRSEQPLDELATAIEREGKAEYPYVRAAVFDDERGWGVRLPPLYWRETFKDGDTDFGPNRLEVGNQNLPPHALLDMPHMLRRVTEVSRVPKAMHPEWTE
jgi:hypothetical protein